MDSNRYMTKKVAAAYITVSERGLDYMRQRGEVPFIRFGGRIMFDRLKLDKIMQAHEVVTGVA